MADRRKSLVSSSQMIDRPAAALPKTPNYATSKFKRMQTDNSRQHRNSFKSISGTSAIAPTNGRPEVSHSIAISTKQASKGPAVPRLRGLMKKATSDFSKHSSSFLRSHEEEKMIPKSPTRESPTPAFPNVTSKLSPRQSPNSKRKLNKLQSAELPSPQVAKGKGRFIF